MPGIERSEFVELFNKMYRPVRNFIYFKTGDIDMADDIAQDTFLRVWEKQDDIRKETVKPLLYTIAGNLCKNRFEHQKVVFEFANKYEHTDNFVSPEFELEMKEFNNKLQKAIGTLKDNNRVVFLMNRIDGFTYNEIAQNLGLSVKAVEKRMKNALDDLKKTIEYKI
jgi:RNA polymerase sigma-70 factor (ECF subfamily)